MKVEIFNKYAEQIAKLFDITKEALFSKSKNRELVDARYLLYYLCFKRPMSISYIQKYMTTNGYEINHSTIIYGINTVEKKIQNDIDYRQIVNEIQNSTFANSANN
jgi:chromosomal replication initiator protein